MKLKLFALLMFTTVSVCVFGQEYKPVKIGMGFGYPKPSGEGSKAGFLVYFEPAYRVNDQIAVGLRFEVAIMGRVAVVANSSGASTDVQLNANGSYTLNGQYYFMNGTFRPFAGLGFGLYTLASASASTSTSGSGTASGEVGAGNKMGFYPRVGFDVSHFSVNLEYNFIPETTSMVATAGSGGSSVTESTTKNSYLAIKLGWFFGGGKKS